MNDAQNSHKLNNVRKRAEAFLEKTPSAIKKMPSKDIRDLQTLVEELQTHQIELRMQGEDLRQSQLELEKARDRYLDLYDFAPVEYVTISDKGVILEANLTSTILLGVERSKLVGMPFSQFIAKEDQDLFYFHKKKLLKSGNQDTCELKLVKMNDRPFHAQLESIVVETNTGELKHFRVAIINRERIWKAEEILRETTAKLQQSHKMEAVGTLAEGISHDFNHFLTIILGNAQLASEDDSEGNLVPECLEEIQLASIRAKEMVQQLLAFSRKTDQNRKPLNLVPVIKESMKMLRNAIPASVEFSQHISDEPCNIMGDASQINQVMMNLVTNAVHAMTEEGGLLEVTLKKVDLLEEKSCFDWVLSPGAYVNLKVRDKGKGMTFETMERIFEPYYTTKEVGKGTGMGLSVVHGIVKRHGGGIRVESEPGKGTAFEIYSPASEEMSEEEKEPDGEIKGGSESILFVDDEQSMVNLNHQRLERLGYQVKSTTSPVETLEWFRADPDQFDIIITDMTMPRMTGDRLTAEVLKIRPLMPVIICTGYSERMSAKKAENLGVRKYIEKPIDTRNLAAALREVLDDGPSRAAPMQDGEAKS